MKRCHIKAPGWKHGGHGSRTYSTWVSMRNRCRNEKDPNFPAYGGRGIKVCKRWHSFTNFLADMGERPAGLTIDREDNDGGYEPGNCSWATPKAQGRNKRNNRLLTVKGETKTLAEWAEDLGISRAALGMRLKNWTTEKAVTTPHRFASKVKGALP